MLYVRATAVSLVLAETGQSQSEAPRRQVASFYTCDNFQTIVSCARTSSTDG